MLECNLPSFAQLNDYKVNLLFFKSNDYVHFFFTQYKSFLLRSLIRQLTASLILGYAGGTFALYSLLRRHAKVNTVPNQHRTDEELTTYSRSIFHESSFAAKTKKWLEANAFRRNSLLMLVLVGTCMVIGDGILTPAISGMYLL